MTTIDYKSQIASEDINWGTGTFQRRLSTGELQELNMVGLYPVSPYIDPRSYGAAGDGVADDTLALAAAVVAAAALGKALFIPAGTFTTTSALTFSAVSAPVSIYGTGANSVIKLTGITNKGIYVTGTAGVTVNPVLIENLKILGATSGDSAAGIHLDGIAIYRISNIEIDGNDAMTYGIRMTASQQGEMAPRYIHHVSNGILLEPNAGNTVASNGADLHGVSLSCSVSNIVLDRVASSFIRGNHLVQAPVSIDITGGGPGPNMIAFNQIEQNTTAGIRIRDSASQIKIICNGFYSGTTGSVDLLVSSGYNHLVDGNLFTGDIQFDNTCGDSIFINNYLSGGVGGAADFTDNSVNADGSTGTIRYSNISVGSAESIPEINLRGDMTITSRNPVAGNVLLLNPSYGISGPWGMKITGQGGATDEIYVQLKDVIVAGANSGGVLNIKSDVGGDVWMRLDTNGAEIQDVPELADNASALATGYTAGRIYRTGDTLKIVHP